MGVLYSLLAALLSSSKDLVSKRLSSSLSGTVSAYASFLFALPYYVILLAALGMLGLEDFILSREFVLLVLLRALTDAGAEWCKMEAIGRADISFISPFLGMAPLFLLATSPLITGDIPSLWGALSVITIVLGSLVLLRGGRKSVKGASKGAVIIALASSFCFSLNTCFDRLAVQVASPVLSGFAMTFVAALFLMPFALRRGRTAAALSDSWRPLWVRGFFELAYMVTKLSALQYLQAPYVAGIGRVSLLFSVVGGKVLFREKDFTRRMLGSLLIMAGVIGIVLGGINSS